MNQMFDVDDYIVYGSSGVCRITDISDFNFIDNQKSKYYVLANVFEPNASVIYAPVDGGMIKMRKILSCEEVLEIIGRIPKMKQEYIEDDKVRKENHRAILREGCPEKLATLLKSLHARKEKRVSEGKKMPMADEVDMHTAEKVLYEEFALALDMKLEDVENFITENIKGA